MPPFENTLSGTAAGNLLLAFPKIGAFPSKELIMGADAQAKRVLIYTMGRVGTTSLYHSLRDRGLQVASFHQLHLDRIEIPVTPYQLLRRAGRRVLFNFEPMLNGGKARIVTTVRDPLKRNISAFFFNLELLAPGYQKRSIEELIEIFCRQENMNRSPEAWFDEELRYFTGLDVLSEPFDHERGYQIVDGQRHIAFVGRTDKLSSLAQEIGDFVGINDLVLPRSNDIGSTSKSEVYAAFKREFRASDEMLESLYQNRFTKHFFTPAEIEKMLADATSPRGS